MDCYIGSLVNIDSPPAECVLCTHAFMGTNVTGSSNRVPGLGLYYHHQNHFFLLRITVSSSIQFIVILMLMIKRYVTLTSIWVYKGILPPSEWFYFLRISWSSSFLVIYCDFNIDDNEICHSNFYLCPVLRLSPSSEKTSLSTNHCFTIISVM